MFRESNGSDDHNGSSDFDNEIDDVLKQPVSVMKSTTSRPVDILDFDDDDNHLEHEPYHKYSEHKNSYSSSEDVKKFKPKRKYSSPPISIYDDTTEDGRIRVSEGDDQHESFTVSDPIKGGHVTYMVRGYDEDGPFEGNKRYNDFYNLRAAIMTRWPGVYCPPIPPKKIIGNKEDKFLEERKHFLERFLMLISKIDHLLKSDEFRLFSRPSGEIDKTVQMLPQVTPDFLLERYKSQLKLDEDVDPVKLKENIATINEYSSFCRTFLKVMKQVRDNMKPYANGADKQKNNYKEVMTTLMRYEQKALLEY